MVFVFSIRLWFFCDQELSVSCNHTYNYKDKQFLHSLVLRPLVVMTKVLKHVCTCLYVQGFWGVKMSMEKQARLLRSNAESKICEVCFFETVGRKWIFYRTSKYRSLEVEECLLGKVVKYVPLWWYYIKILCKQIIQNTHNLSKMQALASSLGGLDNLCSY